MLFTPHKYTEEAIKFVIERGCAGLFLDPGLGKTAIMLASFILLKKLGMVDAMLVIAPLRPCYTVWPSEVKKWDEFKHLKIVILHGPDKDKALRQKADIYIMNPDGLKWLSDKKLSQKDWPFDMLTVDESSKFKHTNTLRFKLMRPMLDRFKRRVILTGSPAANGLLDLFGQMYVMDRGATFGPYITHYKQKYFYQTGYGGYEWALRPHADDEIYETIAPRVLRMSGEEYLKLPKKTFNDVYIDLPPDVRKIYNQMEVMLKVDFDKGRITAANTGVALMKCRQIASGGVYRDDKTVQHIHMLKAEAVEDLIEEMGGQPTIVAYQFEHDFTRLKKLMGKDVPHTSVSPKQWQKTEQEWNEGKIPALYGQTSSLSHGLNLQAGGRSMIIHTPDYNFEDYDQLIRRIWRQGQKKRVVIHRIIARDTVDEVIIKSLSSKEKGQNALFTALRDYLRSKK